MTHSPKVALPNDEPAQLREICHEFLFSFKPRLERPTLLHNDKFEYRLDRLAERENLNATEKAKLIQTRAEAASRKIPAP